MDPTLDELRYPIGRYARPTEHTAAQRTAWIDELRRQPERFRASILELGDRQLDTPYRPDGWTLRQVVHHVADSHLNGYVRVKWALTEADPLIKVYGQEAWAATPEARHLDPSVSIELLDALHRRWTDLLVRLEEPAWRRPVQHPESGTWTVEELVSLYAWHGHHHVAQIRSLRSRMNW